MRPTRDGPIYCERCGHCLGRFAHGLYLLVHAKRTTLAPIVYSIACEQRSCRHVNRLDPEPAWLARDPPRACGCDLPDAGDGDGATG